MLMRATEQFELLLVFPLMIVGILLTHLVQRWADRSSNEDEGGMP
jgi:hypothetical protein